MLGGIAAHGDAALFGEAARIDYQLVQYQLYHVAVALHEELVAHLALKLQLHLLAVMQIVHAGL